MSCEDARQGVGSLQEGDWRRQVAGMCPTFFVLNEDWTSKTVTFARGFDLLLSQQRQGEGRSTRFVGRVDLPFFRTRALVRWDYRGPVKASWKLLKSVRSTSLSPSLSWIWHAGDKGPPPGPVKQSWKLPKSARSTSPSPSLSKGAAGVPIEKEREAEVPWFPAWSVAVKWYWMVEPVGWPGICAR